MEEFTLGRETSVLAGEECGGTGVTTVEVGGGGLPSLPLGQNPVPQLSLIPTAVPDSSSPTTSRKIRP